MVIPLSSPDITELEMQAVQEVLLGRHLSLGPKLQEFEAAGLIRGRVLPARMSDPGLLCQLAPTGLGTLRGDVEFPDWSAALGYAACSVSERPTSASQLLSMSELKVQNGR